MYEPYVFFFFFQAEDGIRDVAVTGVQTCALPIFKVVSPGFLKEQGLTVADAQVARLAEQGKTVVYVLANGDRKSTRLNSSHGYISYAVFCLKKKNNEVRCLYYLLQVGLRRQHYYG